MDQDIFLIVTAYNEAEQIGATLAALADAFPGRLVFLADDGSSDATPRSFAEAAQSLPRGHLDYRYLGLEHRGKGAAVRAGVEAAKGDPIIFLDSDLTIPVDIIDKFLRAIGDGADIAVASRYVPGSVVRRPWWRSLLGVVFRRCVHLLVPVDVSDTQCGGKAYTAEAAKDLFRRSRLEGFSFDAEVLFIARRSGYRVREIPFTLIQDRVTSISFLKETPRMLRDLFLIRMNSLRGRYRA